MKKNMRAEAKLIASDGHLVWVCIYPNRLVYCWVGGEAEAKRLAAEYNSK